MTFRSVRLASLAVVALLLCSTFAQATVIGSATLIKDPSAALPFANSPLGSTYSSLPSPWVSYRLSVTANGGDTIQAVTADIQGTVHQGWQSSTGDAISGGTGYDTQTGNSTNATNGDSHFMATASMLFANGPNEDNTLSGSPLTSDDNFGYGLGTKMSATFGPPGLGLTTMNLAYLVVKKGQEPQVNLNFAIFSPTGDIITTLTNKDFGVFAPSTNLPPTVVDGLINNVKSNDLNPANNPVTFTFTATDDQPTSQLTWSGFGFDSFTQGFGGPAAGAPGFPATFDPVTQKFSWLSNSTPRGIYKWHVTATDAGGLSDQGFLTVNVTAVPEPATLTLVGLAGLCMVGVARRRS